MTETLIGDLKVLQREIKQAKKIQMQLLTAKQPKIVYAEIQGTSVPARLIGGDYYDFYQMEDRKLRFIIADVMGKGIPAAMLMILTRGAFRSASSTTSNPAQTLTVMNDALFSDLRTLSSFVTACCAEWDPVTMTLRFANAGHSWPLCIRNGKVLSTASTNSGVFLGGLQNHDYNESMLKLEFGDYLIFYTDGIIEAQNDSGELYKLERMIDVAVKQEGKSVDEIESAILESVNAYTAGMPQKDDITLVILKIIKTEEDRDV